MRKNTKEITYKESLINHLRLMITERRGKGGNQILINSLFFNVNHPEALEAGYFEELKGKLALYPGQSPDRPKGWALQIKGTDSAIYMTNDNLYLMKFDPKQNSWNAIMDASVAPPGHEPLDSEVVKSSQWERPTPLNVKQNIEFVPKFKKPEKTAEEFTRYMLGKSYQAPRVIATSDEIPYKEESTGKRRVANSWDARVRPATPRALGVKDDPKIPNFRTVLNQPETPTEVRLREASAKPDASSILKKPKAVSKKDIVAPAPVKRDVPTPLMARHVQIAFLQSPLAQSVQKEAVTPVDYQRPLPKHVNDPKSQYSVQAAAASSVPQPQNISSSRPSRISLFSSSALVQTAPVDYVFKPDPKPQYSAQAAAASSVPQPQNISSSRPSRTSLAPAGPRWHFGSEAALDQNWMEPKIARNVSAPKSAVSSVTPDSYSKVSNFGIQWDAQAQTLEYEKTPNRPVEKPRLQNWVNSPKSAEQKPTSSPKNKAVEIRGRASQRLAASSRADDKERW